ncbi:MAG: GldG family protein [Limnochordia bacterium]|jgi:ABC-2 type transport system permease protein
MSEFLKDMSGIGGVIVAAGSITSMLARLPVYRWMIPLFLGIAGIVYYLAYRSSMVRQSKAGLDALTMTLIVLVGLVLANSLVSQNRYRKDMTRTGEMTLSRQTRQVLQRLDALEERLQVYVFFRQSEMTQLQLQVQNMARNLLIEYQLASSKIDIHFVDPDAHPSLAGQFAIESDTTILLTGDEIRRVPAYELYTFTPDGQLQFTGEQAYTRAMMSLVQTGNHSLYFLEGHEEKNIEVEYKKAVEYLKGEGYQVSTLDLTKTRSIPTDVALLIVAGPLGAIAENEITTIAQYLQGGGRAIFLLEPTSQGSLYPLRTLLESFGVLVQENVVADPTRSYFFDPLSPMPVYVYHSITKDLINTNLAMVLPMSRSLKIRPLDDFVLEPLLTTSPEAYGKTKLPIATNRFEEGDETGPLTLAVAVSEEDTGMKFIVMGNAAFLDNNVLAFRGNVDFFLNSVNWLIGREELISISPKATDPMILILSSSQAKLVYTISVIIIPLVLFLLGILTYFRRRRM